MREFLTQMQWAKEDDFFILPTVRVNKGYKYIAFNWLKIEITLSW